MLRGVASESTISYDYCFLFLYIHLNTFINYASKKKVLHIPSCLDQWF